MVMYFGKRFRHPEIKDPDNSSTVAPVIIYGPQGCGKTTNAAAMAQHFNCLGVVDEWSPSQFVLPGHLHLTNATYDEINSISGNPLNTLIYSFDWARYNIPGVGFAAPESEMEVKTSPMVSNTKRSNPKDAIGSSKWRKTWYVPTRVLWHVALAFVEGALKYGAFNWRAMGVRGSVYVEAAEGHIGQWKEGEDFAPDSKVHHLDHAIACLMIMRDSMMQGNFVDDRPPSTADLDEMRARIQAHVDELLAKYPEPKQPYTQQLLAAMEAPNGNG